MSSILKKGATALANVGKKAHKKLHEIKPQKLHGQTIRLTQPNMPRKKLPLTDELKEEIRKSVFMSPDLIETITPENALVKLDSSLEGFFYQREYNLNNFNLLIKMLASKKEIDECLSVLEKMKIMGIKPNRQTYVQLMIGSGKAHDPETAENIYDKALEDLGHTDGSLYTVLISCYVNIANHEKIEALMNEKKAKGYKLTVADFTCYMNALINADKPDKALEFFKKNQTEVFRDEYIISCAIRAAAHMHEAEYAKRLWGELESQGFMPIAVHYNAIILALGKRKDYAEEGLELYKKMRARQIVPDKSTFDAVLTACSRLGDLIAAQHALIDMKNFGINLNGTTYGLMLHTYSEACKDATESAKDVFIRESWELFRQCEEKGLVNNNIVNNLLLVHTKAYRENEAEGLVLPVYQEYGLKKDKFTYRALTEMYTKLNESRIVFRLWDTMLQEHIKPDMYILNNYLTSALRAKDTDRAVEALHSFKANGLMPLYTLINKVHKLDDKPLRLWAAIQDFPVFQSYFHDKEYGERLRDDKVEERFTS